MGSAELLVSICRNDEDGEDGRAPMGAVSHTKSIPPGRGLVWKMELGGGGGGEVVSYRLSCLLQQQQNTVPILLFCTTNLDYVFPILTYCSILIA